MTIKNVNANIYDPDSDDFLCEIGLEIGLVTPSNPDEKPYFEVEGNNLKPIFDGSDKNLIIEINPSLRGLAYFSTIEITGWITKYKIVFLDSVWKDLEWFENL